MYWPVLYLNRFRRKPAMARFDQPFTPNYNSSQHFATCTSAVLKYILLYSQPGHSQITQLRVLIDLMQYALFKLAFATPSLVSQAHQAYELADPLYKRCILSSSRNNIICFYLIVTAVSLPQGFSFTFPSRYSRLLSMGRHIFRQRRWTSYVQTTLFEYRLTSIPSTQKQSLYKTITFYGIVFQTIYWTQACSNKGKSTLGSLTTTARISVDLDSFRY